MASLLVRSSPDPGCGHCVVFLGKTLNSPPRCINGYNLMLGVALR